MSTAPTSPSRPIERLAAALQDCFNAAVEEGREQAEARIDAKIDARFDAMEQRMDARLDRQDETLRMVWKQVKGNGKLPIDE